MIKSIYNKLLLKRLILKLLMIEGMSINKIQFW